jgi:hypothetical protein
VPRNNPNSGRMFRGHKISKGRVSVRKLRYDLQPGDTVLYQGKRYIAKGCHSNGNRVMLDNGKSVPIKQIRIVRFTGGWITI